MFVNFQNFCATSDGLQTTKRSKPLENTGIIRILRLKRCGFFVTLYIVVNTTIKMRESYVSGLYC